MAALHLAVVPWSIWFDELMPDAQLSGGGLEQYEKTPFAVGEAISELKAIVGLDTLHLNAPADIPFYKPFQEISRGIGGLLRIGHEEPQAGELIYRCILKKSQFRVANALSGYHFHIHLNPLARIGHLLIGFGLIFLLFLTIRKQSQLLHNPVQALGVPAIASLLRMPPELNQTQARIPAAHISDQLQLILGMLIRMAVRPFGLTVILYMIAKTKSLCYTL